MLEAEGGPADELIFRALLETQVVDAPWTVFELDAQAHGQLGAVW